MAGRRVVDSSGNRMPFSCENRAFRTNVNKGETHGAYATTRGSVFKEPLIEGNGWTLWLEHVEEISSGNECYWFMWYQPNGEPTIPLSGVFGRKDLANMQRMLADFVP